MKHTDKLMEIFADIIIPAIKAIVRTRCMTGMGLPKYMIVNSMKYDYVHLVILMNLWKGCVY